MITDRRSPHFRNPMAPPPIVVAWRPWSVQRERAPLSFSEAAKATVPAAWTVPAAPNGWRLERARKMSRGATAETVSAEVLPVLVAW